MVEGFGARIGRSHARGREDFGGTFSRETDVRDYH